MTLPVIVIGSGGHASVVVETLRASGRAVLAGLTFSDDELASTHPPGAYDLVNGVGHLEDRRRVFAFFVERGYAFVAAIHPFSYVAPGVAIAPSTQIMAGAVVQPGASIGRNALINTGARVDHDCVIGAHAHVAPGATLCGSVTIGEGAYVGAGATVLPGVDVGAGSTVGAGAVVLADVAPGLVVFGVPARERL